MQGAYGMIANQWYAILPSKAVKADRVTGLKRMGLDLALFRNSKGELGCVVGPVHPSRRCVQLGQGKG